MKEEKEYQFLYWKDSPMSVDLISIIKAKSIKGACGKFMRNRKNVQYRILIDYEVMIVPTFEYVEIREIKSVKEFTN